MRLISNALPICAGLLALVVTGEDKKDPPAPASDRVGFPAGYRETFQEVRFFNRTNEQQVVTIYENARAASVKQISDLPYPYGSIVVMETASALRDAQGKPVSAADGRYAKDKVVGLHVARREKGFGEAYGTNRAGEWEYVEYQADQGYRTPPAKSFACAKCHVEAGAERDFVYRGRFPEKGK